MLSIIFPIAFAAVLQNPTPSNQNPTKEEVIVALHQQFLDDMPKAWQVSKCESTFKQFKDDGSTVISETGDAGIMQINIKTWDKTAKKLGLDYKNSWRDNILMAKVVYNEASSTFEPWTCKRNI